jgi:hypothetical protein
MFWKTMCFISGCNLLYVILVSFYVQPVTVKEHPEIALHDREHEHYNGSTLFRKIFQLQRLVLFIHVRQSCYNLYIPAEEQSESISSTARHVNEPKKS